MTNSTQFSTNTTSVHGEEEKKADDEQEGNPVLYWTITDVAGIYIYILYNIKCK